MTCEELRAAWTNMQSAFVAAQQYKTKAEKLTARLMQISRRTTCCGTHSCWSIQSTNNNNCGWTRKWSTSYVMWISRCISWWWQLIRTCSVGTMKITCTSCSTIWIYRRSCVKMPQFRRVVQLLLHQSHLRRLYMTLRMRCACLASWWLHWPHITTSKLFFWL